MSDPAPAKLRLPGHVECPPGGLSYKVEALAERAPGLAWVTGHHVWEVFVAEIHRRELANNVPLSAESDIENQVCQRLPRGYCIDAVTGRPSQRAGSMALTLPDVVTGTRALLRWFKHGSVDASEIARRTAICNACPENRPIAGCTGCAASALHSVMNAIVVKALPSDAVLHACSICKCSLKAKVRFHLSDLPALAPEQVARLPEACWLHGAPALSRDSDPRL